MAININNLNNNNQVNHNKQTQAKQQSEQAISQGSQVKSTRQDYVSITPQAQQLNELQKKAADGPAINQKKIDELKKAISSGEYKVHPEKLAANMANLELDLL